MLENGELTEWEKGFISSIKRQKTLSEKQQIWFEKIRNKYLSGPVEAKVGSGELPDDQVPF